MRPITVPIAILLLATAAGAPVGPNPPPAAAAHAAATLNATVVIDDHATHHATQLTTNYAARPTTEGPSTAAVPAAAPEENATAAAATTAHAPSNAPSNAPNVTLIAMSRRDRRDWEDNDWGDNDWSGPGVDYDDRDSCDGVICPVPRLGVHHDYTPCCHCGSDDTLCQEQEAEHGRVAVIIVSIMITIIVIIAVLVVVFRSSCTRTPRERVAVYTPLPTYGSTDQWSSKPVGPSTGYPPTTIMIQNSADGDVRAYGRDWLANRTLYCGGYRLGGVCGPSNGPQCDACRLASLEGLGPTRNLAGDPMSWGKDWRYRHVLYCGKRVGRFALAPGSNGRCGPNNGPRCANCRPFAISGTPPIRMHYISS